MVAIRRNWPVVLAFAVSGCAAKSPVNPFLVTPAALHQNVRIVAALPTDIGLAHECGCTAARAVPVFDSLVASHLRAAGFTVVPAARTWEVWRQVMDSVGGVFDPVTGAMDTLKGRQLLQAMGARLRADFSADAVVQPSIQVVVADWESKWASWDGVRQSIQTTGGLFGEALLGIEASGTLPALSLAVDIKDLEGKLLYRNRGGIQTLTRRAGRGFIRVPDGDLLSDSMFVRRAVTIAVGPLGQGAR